jgi:hypothetical protein
LREIRALADECAYISIIQLGNSATETEGELIVALDLTAHLVAQRRHETIKGGG